MDMDTPETKPKPIMGIRALAVDFGGVLLLSNPDRAIRCAAKVLGLSVEEVRRALWKGEDVEAANRGRISAEEYFERAAPRLGVPARRAGEIIEALFAGVPNGPLVNWLAGRRPGVRIAAFTKRLVLCRTHSGKPSCVEICLTRWSTPPKCRLLQAVPGDLRMTLLAILDLPRPAKSSSLTIKRRISMRRMRWGFTASCMRISSGLSGRWKRWRVRVVNESFGRAGLFCAGN